MTILEAIQSINTYPIPVNAILLFCADRGLVSSDTYTQAIGQSKEYRLAYADSLMWLHDSPSIVEQEVGLNNAIAIKQDMAERANQIYGGYSDAKYNGKSFGFIGENWNG